MKTFAIALCLCLVHAISLHAQLADFDSVDFEKADSIAEVYSNHSLRNLKTLSDKLTKPLSSEAEKFRAIYKWVCNNIDYDYALFKKNELNRRNGRRPEELAAWNKEFTSMVFKNLLNKQKTICTGYAYLVKELALHAGISCVIVDGYGRTSQSNVKGTGFANHSWNAVKINNKWYLADPTWSSGSYSRELAQYIRNFNESYFLADPALFVRNHYPIDSAWVLLNQKPTLKEFLFAPLVYSSAVKYQIEPLQPATFDVEVAKGKSVSFRFALKNNQTNEEMRLLVLKQYSPSSTISRLGKDSSGFYYVDHTFATKGKHIVHLMIDTNYAVTYSVDVQ